VFVAARKADDLRWLRPALRLAERGRGRTRPNPMVGAVLVRGDKVVGRGWHARAGSPHAEVRALREAGEKARGARLYVNLEPCRHFGRTPPCTDAIVAAGVREVIACMSDPDPRVGGRGFAALRKAGVKVRIGTLRAEAERLNAPYLRRQRTGLPSVTLKAGMSLDGRIATRAGRSQWITSAAARREARRLRGRHDAVLVGVGTLLADDPRLSAAGTNGHAHPVRVILDSRLRTPPGSKVLRSRGGPVVLLARRDAPAARRARLERAGATIVAVGARRGRVDLRSGLRALGRRGISSVLIEGGGEVLGAALDGKVGDRLVLYVAPRLLGGSAARPAFAGRGTAPVEGAARLVAPRWRRLAGDWVIEAGLDHRRH
jgi:diaminohydroxyphosphoribosylaminopyrimidine deaminase/5-amino-6-(5-phosphoribosylamino)uracil reductase